MCLQWTWFSSVCICQNARALRSWLHRYLHPSGMVASFVCPSHILRMQTNVRCLLPLPSPSRSACLETFSRYSRWNALTSYAKAPKNKSSLSDCAKELVLAPFITLVSHWYQLDSNKATANISWFLALTTHFNGFKCTFKPLEIILLIETKFEYIFEPFTRAPTSIELLHTAFTMPLLPLNT